MGRAFNSLHWGILAFAGLGVAAGLALWLGADRDGAPEPPARESIAVDRDLDTPDALERTARRTPPESADAEEAPPATTPAQETDNPREAREEAPVAPEAEPEWNPENFQNARFLTVPPAVDEEANSTVKPKEGESTYMFLPGEGSYQDWRKPTRKQNGVVDDGALRLSVHYFGYNHDDEGREAFSKMIAGAVTTVTGPGNDTVYRFRGRECIIPSEIERSDTLGITVEGPGILTSEAIVSCMGTGGDRGAYGSHYENIHINGLVRVRLRIFPADYSHFRTVNVRDEGGRPVENAALIHSDQVFGRSDESGALRFPWPRSYTSELVGRGITKTYEAREQYFFLSVPGYVPVLIERSELEDRSTPLEITVRARELLVSAHHRLSDPSVMEFGIYPYTETNSGSSEVLTSEMSLVALPDDFREIESWEDAHRSLCGSLPQVVYDRRTDADAKNELTSFGSLYAASFYPDDYNAFGRPSADRLGEALGRQPTKAWGTLYARWYFGRWDYDHGEGRFDAVLPYPGRFLVVVGEYNRGGQGELLPDGDRAGTPEGRKINGAITHVLYLDARNPAEMKSKLLVHLEG